MIHKQVTYLIATSLSHVSNLFSFFMQNVRNSQLATHIQPLNYTMQIGDYYDFQTRKEPQSTLLEGSDVDYKGSAEH